MGVVRWGVAIAALPRSGLLRWGSWFKSHSDTKALFKTAAPMANVFAPLQQKSLIRPAAPVAATPRPVKGNC